MRLIRRAGLACLMVIAGAPGSIVAQGALAGTAPNWSWSASEFTDLWFGGLAQVGFVGEAGAPLYDLEFAEQARARKTAVGVYPTTLDRDADGLRLMFQANPAFEVLHFVPVYFAGLSTDEALDALQAVAASTSGVPPAPSVSSRFGVTAVASVLTGREERQVLAAFLEDLREERAGYLDAAWAEQAAERSAGLARLRTRWTDAYQPYLAPYLQRQRLDFGMVLVTPTLAGEGRFFQGDPENEADNAMIVGQDTWTTPPDLTLARVVRELCFPAVRSAFARADVQFATRVAANRASDNAAIRCGEMLLEAQAPHLVASYRAAFPVNQRFDQHAPTDGPAMDPTVEEILAETLRNN